MHWQAHTHTHTHPPTHSNDWLRLHCVKSRIGWLVATHIISIPYVGFMHWIQLCKWLACSRPHITFAVLFFEWFKYFWHYFTLEIVLCVSIQAYTGYLMPIFDCVNAQVWSGLVWSGRCINGCRNAKSLLADRHHEVDLLCMCNALMHLH